MLYILKIGGSVCTEKDENNSLAKEETIRRIAHEIKEAREKEKFQLVLVHGAGPFGHKLVTEYGVNNGLDSKEDFDAYEKVQESMKKLNNIVVEEFAKEGVELHSVVPHEEIKQDNKRITSFDTQILEQLLSNNQVPILYGDMVPDSKLGGSVVSGDAIIAFLAKKFKANKVFLGTDVDGIYSADPKKDINAKRFDKINESNWLEVENALDEASTVDVTGGMKGKIEKMRKYFKGGKVVVFDANKPGSVLKALSGERLGTLLEF